MPDFYDLPPTEFDEEKPGSREYEILQWCNTKLERAAEFLQSQVGYDKIESAIKEVFSYELSSTATYSPTAKLSQTRANLIADIAETLTAMLTDTRLFWKYTTENPKYQEQVRLSNKTAENWFRNGLISLRLADVTKFYTLAGTGQAHIYYSRAKNDMVVESVDPRNVFPVDPLSYHTNQDCRAIIVRMARTPEWVKEEYGKAVRPDTGGGAVRTALRWLRSSLDGPASSGGPLSSTRKSDNPIPHVDTVFVNTMYLHDPRKNKTGKVIYMGKWEDGKPQTPWSYEVHSGQPLYPFNRLIVWGGNVIMYDGPAPYWSSSFPVFKLTLNPWPMSWFGKAPVWDCIPLNHTINKNLRVIDDHCAQVAEPALIGDRNVSRAEMKKASTREPGMKIHTNLASGKGMQIVPPPPLDSVIWEVIKWCQETMQKLAGTADMSSIASLNQIPSDDTIDTIMKAMTPGVRMRSRILEGFYEEIAQFYLTCIMEFDTISKRVARFGPNAITAEDFDYAPDTMIPDDIPDGDIGDIAQTSFSAMNPRPLYKRAQVLMASITCMYEPSSLLNSAAQQDLMKYFLLAKMGYVSVFTLLEKVGFNSFAPPDMKIPPDEISRLALQQQLGIGMMANSQGRKATDVAPPKMGQNANGPTITTS